MKSFLCENFLLSTRTAEKLYHDYAENMPIFDYHCHLNPKEIAENRQFKDLSEIWLEGDHYKWRAMRTAGIEEHFITGSATHYEKYLAWAKTVPLCIGNPIYHWTHLELRRPFGIHNKLFNPENAVTIWHECNEMLQQPAFSARGIMQQMNVKLAGTTDDPIDSLHYHKVIAEDKTFDIDVVPSWRPDKIFKIELPTFNDYIQQLAEVADIEITNFSTLQQAILKRLDHFEQHGCKSADHSIEIVRFADIPTEQELDKILHHRRQHQPLTELQIAQFSTAILVWLGQEYHKRQWVMQFHIGAIRNNNSRMFRLLGADSGFDSIGDRMFAEPLSKLLDAMDKTNQLPKTILYCLNPRDNEVIGSMIGNFQGDGIAGKIQFGSGWWFNDQKDGMERQLEQLSQLGLLSQFVGMLTDSRSFLSYTRHEYFRRILCEKLGCWVENGEAPNDLTLLGNMVQNICFNNAKRYFK
ncbi:Uronate isomerase [Pasteurella multocida]|uniref:glucuronate isomerase n=1 Tax=Pasteurella multocida TaxID=747 RepID=UPI0007ECC76B|nr:glucuronate isomerase [Pasteurella multocida]MCL7823308.1 glucuronate isomerase [Pasteurella multocida]OBP32901.1 uronate isomerase [Pasteurella multocida subsp. multocida]TAA82801.1 Uronate isomerase [Pasteurella multocida]URH97830.1 glucuronate isomerase [Pasteurella multocida]URJ93307.1 glucuronate isomerase [Pasteurella multocida]